MGLHRSDKLAPRFSLPAESSNEIAEIVGQPPAGIDQEELEQRGHLIVARASRVQLLPDVTDQFDHARLDPGVDVLGAGVGATGVRVALGDLVESTVQLADFLPRKDLRAQQRFDVSPLKPKLIRQEKPIFLEAAIVSCEGRVECRLLLPEGLHFPAPGTGARWRTASSVR